MALKLLQNVIHHGVLLHAEEVVEGIEDKICAEIVKRGLAEETTEAATKVFTEAGVEPKSVINPAAQHSAPVDGSSTAAVAGQPVATAASVAPVAPVAPVAVTTNPVPPVTVTTPSLTQPTPDEISKSVEGV